MDKSAISDISGLGKSPFMMKFDDQSNLGRESHASGENSVKSAPVAKKEETE